MKKKLKTITLGDTNGNMSIVFCRGHVGAWTFNRAFKNEGWGEIGNYKIQDLRYEYAIIKTGKMRKDGTQKVSLKVCAPEKKGAVKVTITNWD